MSEAPSPEDAAPRAAKISKLNLLDNPKIRAKAEEMDPLWWRAWDSTPEHRKFMCDYETKVLKLFEAAEALGLPE